MLIANSFRAVLQFVSDYAIKYGYNLNLCTKKLFLSSDVKVGIADCLEARANGLNLIPWIIGVWAGYAV